MNTKTVALGLTAAGFAALTAWAVLEHGLIDLFTWLASRPAGILLMTDLVIALVLVLLWMWNDARTRGLNAVPYVLVTLCAGSLGPLLYLIARERRPAR